MTNFEKRLIVLANKIPFPSIVKCPDKKGAITCPFKERHAHGDQNKSAYYYKETNLIHCFSFHNTWTPVSLLAEKSGCTKLVAAKYLLKKFGVSETGVYSNKPKIDLTVFDTLRDEKWEDLLVLFGGEQEQVGVVNFINDMELEAENVEGCDLVDLVASDARKIQELIEEKKHE